jgi:hypothetical protein
VERCKLLILVVFRELCAGEVYEKSKRHKRAIGGVMQKSGN